MPLLRDPLVTSALVVGAMSPDVPYFVPGVTWWQRSHSWSGLVTVCIPITLLLVAVYWAVMAAPLRALAPSASGPTAAPAGACPTSACAGRALALVLAGAALGAATHILWDGFTHEGRFGVLAVPWLQQQDAVGPLPGLPGPALCELGHRAGVSSPGRCVRWYRRTPPAPDVPVGVSWGWRMGFAGSLLLAGVLAWWSALDLLGRPTDLYDVRSLVLVGITKSIAFMGLVALLGVLPVRAALLRVETA